MHLAHIGCASAFARCRSPIPARRRSPCSRCRRTGTEPSICRPTMARVDPPRARSASHRRKRWPSGRHARPPVPLRGPSHRFRGARSDARNGRRSPNGPGIPEHFRRNVAGESPGRLFVTVLAANRHRRSPGAGGERRNQGRRRTDQQVRSGPCRRGDDPYQARRSRREAVHLPVAGNQGSSCSCHQGRPSGRARRYQRGQGWKRGDLSLFSRQSVPVLVAARVQHPYDAPRCAGSRIPPFQPTLVATCFVEFEPLLPTGWAAALWLWCSACWS